MRTIFGKLNLPNPRLYTCSCQPQATKSVTPLAYRLPERTTPELKYLQSKWASLVSYGLTVNLLEEALPLTANTMTIRRHTQETAERGPEVAKLSPGARSGEGRRLDPPLPLVAKPAAVGCSC